MKNPTGKEETNVPNTEETTKQQKKSSGVAIVFLALLVILTLLSGILLSLRLIDYITVDEREVALTSNLDTEFELFAAEYKNASGEITVTGTDGENIIAPGTSVEYTIRLRNTDKTAIDYDMTPDIHFTSEHNIPILVRMLAPDGTYIVGDANNWVDVEELNAMNEHKTLKKGESVEYVFQWQWAFESGDNAYDTELGNASVATDIGLSVAFSVHAEANTNVANNGGVMESGLGSIILLGLLTLLLVGAVVLLIIYIVKKRKSEKI